jgi:glycosyltransferase involved in cell wall biosynthesis
MAQATTRTAAAHARVSVVIPCLNESRTIGDCITTVMNTFARHGINGEIVVVDNGSTDDSAAVARRMGARVVDEPQPGYGSALQRGFAAAQGDVIVMGDSDGSYDFSQLLLLTAPLSAGADFVIGSRLRGTILPGAMPLKNRYFGTPILSWLLRRMFKVRISDVNCGMRAFKRTMLERVQLSTSGMEFATEMLVKAAAAGITIAEVPITFRPDNRDRPPHLRPWRDGWRHLKFMLMLAPGYLFLLPGLAMLTIGGAVLSIGFLDTDSRFAPARLGWMIVGSLSAIVGYQVVTLHFYARIYSYTEHLRRDPMLESLFEYLNLERGLAVGLVAVVIGIAVGAWGFAGNGMRSADDLLLGATAIVLGLQTMFSSFFLSIMGDPYQSR